MDPATCAIIHKDSNFLIARRAEGQNLAGKLRCLVRGTREENGSRKGTKKKKKDNRVKEKGRSRFFLALFQGSSRAF